MQVIRPKDSSSKQQAQVKSPGSKERNSRSPVNAEGSTNLFDIKEVVKTSRMKPSKHQTDVIQELHQEESVESSAKESPTKSLFFSSNNEQEEFQAKLLEKDALIEKLLEQQTDREKQFVELKSQLKQTKSQEHSGKENVTPIQQIETMRNEHEASEKQLTQKIYSQKEQLAAYKEHQMETDTLQKQLQSQLSVLQASHLDSQNRSKDQTRQLRQMIVASAIKSGQNKRKIQNLRIQDQESATVEKQNLINEIDQLQQKATVQTVELESFKEEAEILENKSQQSDKQSDAQKQIKEELKQSLKQQTESAEKYRLEVEELNAKLLQIEITSQERQLTKTVTKLQEQLIEATASRGQEMIDISNLNKQVVAYAMNKAALQRKTEVQKDLISQYSQHALESTQKSELIQQELNLKDTNLKNTVKQVQDLQVKYFDLRKSFNGLKQQQEQSQASFNEFMQSYTKRIVAEIRRSPMSSQTLTINTLEKKLSDQTQKQQEENKSNKELLTMYLNQVTELKKDKDNLEAEHQKIKDQEGMLRKKEVQAQEERCRFEHLQKKLQAQIDGVESVKNKGQAMHKMIEQKLKDATLREEAVEDKDKQFTIDVKNKEIAIQKSQEEIKVNLEREKAQLLEQKKKFAKNQKDLAKREKTEQSQKEAISELEHQHEDKVKALQIYIGLASVMSLVIGFILKQFVM